MKRLLSALMILTLLDLVLSSCNHDYLYGDVAESLPPILTAHFDSININIPGYYSGTPARYEISDSLTRYPLLICLHGAGGFGNGFEELKRVLAGVPGVVKKSKFPASFRVNDKAYSFIILAPQFRAYPSNGQIKSFLKYAEQKYRIDPTRIYLTGFSLGGRMATDYAAKYPFEIAAVIAMGGCSTSDSATALSAKCTNMANSSLPVWVFHNEDDLAWPVGDSKTFISTLRSIGPAISPKLTIFYEPEGPLNHDCWTRASDPNYREENKNIYEWMLGFTR